MLESVDPKGLTPKDIQQIEQKSIRNLTPVSEDYVLWQWAVGEAQNPKWERRDSQMSHALQEKIKAVTPQNFDRKFNEEERRSILNAFLNDKDRQDVVKLLGMKCQWFMGDIQIDGIRGFYMVQWPLSQQMAPPGKLLEYAKAFQAGKFPQEAKRDVENIERMRKTFDISKMIGAPIVLSQSSKPPYCAIDGITRLSAIILGTEEGKIELGQLPIILGVSERIFDWNVIPQQMKMV